MPHRLFHMSSPLTGMMVVGDPAPRWTGLPDREQPLPQRAVSPGRKAFDGGGGGGRSSPGPLVPPRTHRPHTPTDSLWVGCAPLPPHREGHTFSEAAALPTECGAPDPVEDFTGADYRRRLTLFCRAVGLLLEVLHPPSSSLPPTPPRCLARRCQARPVRPISDTVAASDTVRGDRGRAPVRPHPPGSFEFLRVSVSYSWIGG